MNDIALFAQAVFSQFQQIGAVYLSSFIFAGVIALYIFRRVVLVIRRIFPS